MAQVDHEPGPSRWVNRVTAALLLAAALGLLLWLSQRHAQELRLHQEGQRVLVQRGRWAPWGWKLHQPGQAFAPIPVEQGVHARVGLCADLADCEARLFEVALEQARRALRDPARREGADALVLQAMKLASPAQRDSVLELQGDEQYLRGLRRLEQGRALLEQAQQSFQRAQAMDARAFTDTPQRLERLRRALQALESDAAAPPAVAPPLPQAAPPQEPRPQRPAPNQDAIRL